MIKQCKTGVSEGDANFLDEMEEQDDVIYQYLIKALDFFYQNTFEYRYAMISILRVMVNRNLIKGEIIIAQNFY